MLVRHYGLNAIVLPRMKRRWSAEASEAGVASLTSVNRQHSEIIGICYVVS